MSSVMNSNYLIDTEQTNESFLFACEPCYCSDVSQRRLSANLAKGLVTVCVVAGMSVACGSYGSVAFSNNLSFSRVPIVSCGTKKPELISFQYNGDTDNNTSYQMHSFEGTMIDEEVDFMKNIEKLNEYKNFEYNWNGNNAEPFTTGLLAKAAEVLNILEIQPSVFPTARNSIQLEYEDLDGEYLELEVFEDRIDSLYMDLEGNEDVESIDFDKDSIMKVVSKFHGQSSRA